MIRKCQLCEKNKGNDEITDAEIEEIWMIKSSDGREPIRLNVKRVRELQPE